MILVDSQIKSLVEQGKLIKEGYNPNNINCISYDLTLESIVIENGEDSYEYVDNINLEPGQFVYVKSKELLCIPNNVLGRVAQKNSIMRIGLVVDGPHYQPGHTTYSFLRVQNISGLSINLKQGRKIAQIIFEELSKEPDVPYNKDDRASFNNEFNYKGFGKYKNQYSDAIKKIENMNEDLDEKENRIYGNIITFMGIFISIFSIITVNFELFSQRQLTATELTKNMIIINLSLGAVITFLMAIIAFIINKVRKKVFIVIASIIIILMVIFNVLFWIPKVDTSDNSYKAVEIILEDSNITIKKVQELLNKNGYALEITGELDKDTYKAIDEYKKENNIITNSLIELIEELNK